MTAPREPLLRLLATNLAIGVTAALLMLAGLVWLNPSGLRDLILADRSPAMAVSLLVLGFVVTFGSAAMGSAIMMCGMHRRSDGRGKSLAPRGGTEAWRRVTVDVHRG